MNLYEMNFMTRKMKRGEETRRFNETKEWMFWKEGHERFELPEN